MFEDRSISNLAYNLETVLAEKFETLLSRGTANTRMRDFYDIYALKTTQRQNIDIALFRQAFANTSKKRGSQTVVSDAKLILYEIQESKEMKALWKNYQNKFDYATGIEWGDVVQSAKKLCNSMDRVNHKHGELER